MSPMICPLREFLPLPGISAKVHPLRARNRSSFSIANAFAKRRQASSKVHKPISNNKMKQTHLGIDSEFRPFSLICFTNRKTQFKELKTQSQNNLLKCTSSNGLECFAYANEYLISVRLKYQLSLLLTAPYPTRIKQTLLYLRPDIISQSMASFQLLHSLPIFLTNFKLQKNHKKASFLASDSEPQNSHTLTHIARDSYTSNNGALDSPKPTRRVRTKKPTSSSSSSSSSTITPKKTKRSTKTKVEKSKLEAKETTNEAKNTDPDPNSDELFDYDDGIDFPYLDPPLICCFGGARKEFVPTVRVSDNQMDPDIYSEWKNLQWDPPEFVRAPGGPPSNVAISHVRLGGRAAFMGKVAKDEFGEELVRTMNVERVQTRAVKFDKSGGVKTACAYVKIVFDEDGKMRSEVAKEAAEDSLLVDELNLAVLKEARLFHFNSEVLISPLMKSTLFRAIAWSKKFGGLIFFDLNLPLPLWRSRDETREIIKKAWSEANIIEVSRQELEFLLDEDYYERKKNYRHEYHAENFEQTKNRRNYYHYTREEISPLWHDGLKFLFVTDGTLRIHYYTPSFDGVVIGTEDVLITPFTCDRTGSGDAVVAGIMRKLTTYPEMFENQDILERQLRFAIAAGIISQWTIGAVRGFPTESAAQNLKEQVYIPSMW